MTPQNKPDSKKASRLDPLSHILVPVAHETDAKRTAKSLKQYSFGRVTVLHVVEKRQGTYDKTPIEYSEELAEKSYRVFREEIPNADSEITYRSDIVEAIFEVAEEIDATAIAFRPREGRRILRFLSGDLSLKLVTKGDRPVIALPNPKSIDS